MGRTFQNLFTFEYKQFDNLTAVDTSYINCVYKDTKYEKIVVFHNNLETSKEFSMICFKTKKETGIEVPLGVIEKKIDNIEQNPL